MQLVKVMDFYFELDSVILMFVQKVNMQEYLENCERRVMGGWVAFSDSPIASVMK